MQGHPPTTYFLWIECPFSEWNCWAHNSRSVGEGPEAATPCLCQLASSSPFCIVAIRPVQCCPSPQQFASAEGWEVNAWPIQLNLSRAQYEACAHFCMLSIRVTKCIGFRQVATQMVSHARLGLSLEPSPTHARNVYLVLYLMTGCVSSQCHCQFVDVFEMTRHSRPDVFDTNCWQQLAGPSRVAQILSDLARPTQSSTVSQKNLLENRPDDLDDFSMPRVDLDATIDGESLADGGSQATGSTGNSCTSQASH